ncbi:microtubule-associated protein TORTIFOLIA1-like isoform X2 [Andrographis paniculata]|uniref:microtubule-associated protein TORTIFOLIA1-like isoform X2 n=1 Tax=Andrographis paniculata TaxID=175694 RepID=UPI0021E86F1D|nr:microtubule-associated protein TORTIFOLIA1-like isoform X2 [Andrographis paniculata]
MSSQRSAKPTKSPSQTTPSRSSSSSASSLSSHLAMVELKQRILNSLSKLADRDTHQIAVEDLEKTIHSISNDGISMLLNCLCDAVNDPKPAVKKESLRLLAALCAAHTDPAATHLTKIISHIVRRLKDSDSQVRDACRDTIGSLAGLYLKCGGGAGDGAVSLFVKPLFEAMNENNKTAQAGASMCMAKMVECATDLPPATFQKLCPRVCKYLNNPNFFAKASLLQVVSSLSQVGAIAPQNLDQLLPSIHEYLGSSDWATRKAAADALSALALNTGCITSDKATTTLNVLETCRFDKIKPVRESMTEALQLWKKIAGKGDGSSDELKAMSHDSPNKKDQSSLGVGGSEKSTKTSSNGFSPPDSSSKGNANNNSEKAIGSARKKVPALSDKERNPEFFQKLETRGSGDLPVEVVVPRRHASASNSQSDENPDSDNPDPSTRSMINSQARAFFKAKYESGSVAERNDPNQRDSSAIYGDSSRNVGLSDGLLNNKGNSLSIQRQLLQLERQQAHLMNMLQDFMGGSHDSMVTLESRVLGLERVVEDMARNLSVSTGRRGINTMAGFEGSMNRHSTKYGFQDYSNSKLGSGNDGRPLFGERYGAFEGVASRMRSRVPSWRSEAVDAWDVTGYSKHAQIGSRRAGGGGNIDIRPGTSESEANQAGSRKGWEKGSAPVRFGEGPSARSVWQASKDEATLEAIRVAGEDNGVARSARAAVPEMTAEALGEDGAVPERDPVWTSWSNAMDALHVGDMDSAFAEVLCTGDDLLLVKLMDRTGPVIDQLSTEVANEVLQVVGQLLTGQNFSDMCLYWLQQLADIVVENGPDVLEIPTEVRREIIVNLHDACSSLELPEDWEGPGPEQTVMQLASGWEIDLQHLGK